MDTREQATPSDLGIRIRRRRLALGLSTAEVAARSGLSTHRIEHIESRPFVLTRAELVRLSHALDLTVDDLTGPPPSTLPRHHLPPVVEPMPKAECVKLIQAGTVGRIAYAGADGLVLIPVNYCTLGELIAFRTAADSAVAQYTLAPIAFHLDSFGEGPRDGWSILVNGLVRPATGREADTVRDRVEPWAGGVRDSAMVIEPHRITGHRF